jgi:hypothetical protein
MAALSLAQILKIFKYSIPQARLRRRRRRDAVLIDLAASH